jgi:hypothetical protein
MKEVFPVPVLPNTAMSLGAGRLSVAVAQVGPSRLKLVEPPLLCSGSPPYVVEG